MISAGVDCCKNRTLYFFEDRKNWMRSFIHTYTLMRRLFGVYYISQPQCFRLVEQKIMESLKDIPDSRELFIVLTSPSELSIIKQEELDWLNVLLSSKRHVQEITDHYHKYRFLGSDEGTPFKTFEYFSSKYKEECHIDRLELERKRNKLLQQKKETEKKRNEALKITNSRIIDDLTQTVCDFALIRFKIRFAWVTGEWVLRRIFEEIGKRFGLSVVDLENYLFDELNDLLIDSRKISQDILGARQDKCVAYLENGRMSLVVEQEAEEYVRLRIVGEKRSAEIKGSCASRGFVRGKVKILNHDAQDISHEMMIMEKGSILVATQTKPQLMTAIAKASAIITDEGGICSHAAIISREFGIPAIIGTGNATKMLKDGDFVEVDADNGIVRKI